MSQYVRTTVFNKISYSKKRFANRNVLQSLKVLVMTLCQSAKADRISVQSSDNTQEQLRWSIQDYLTRKCSRHYSYKSLRETADR